MKALYLVPILAIGSQALNIKRSFPSDSVPLSINAQTPTGNETTFASSLEAMKNGVNWAVAKMWSSEYKVELDQDEGAAGNLEKRATWPWSIYAYQDRNAFSYWLFTSITVTDGSTTQTRKMLLDTGSSDAWMAPEANTNGWSLSDGTMRSINYGFGTVSNIQMYSVPTMTVGSFNYPNFQIGYVANRPSFLDDLSSDKISGILGLGPASLAGLTAANSWTSWCTTQAYVLTALQKIDLCQDKTGGALSLPFYGTSDRAVFSASTATITVGSSTFNIAPQPMLLDTGSGYIILDDATAQSIASAMKTRWPISQSGRRRSENSANEPEFHAQKMRLTRRQGRTGVGSGPYPSKVNTLTTKFYQIACSSGDFNLNINGKTFLIPSSAYVFRDNKNFTLGYGACYSAIVGVDYNNFVNTGDSFPFSILGLPFFRSPNVNQVAVNHATRMINIFQ